MMAKVYSANDIVEEARTWIGTPYQHQCSTKGVATDCVGLIKGLWETVNEDEIEVEPYSYDWGDSNGHEGLVEQAEKFFVEIPVTQMDVSDIVGIQWKKERVVKHTMILTSKNSAIHSYYKSGVVEVNLNSWWKDKIVKVYRWPHLL